MKQILQTHLGKALLILLMVVLGGSNAWGEEQSLEVTTSNFSEITTSYTTKFTHTFTLDETNSVTLEAYGVYKNSGIQINKGKGTYIKNTTAFPGYITKIIINWAASGKNSPKLYFAKDGVASTGSTLHSTGDNTKVTQTYTITDASTKGYNYFYFDGTTVTGACVITKMTIFYEIPSTSAVATPTFSVAEGTYTTTQNVTITTATEGATIYYTTDGATPTTNSSVYSSAIPVSSTTTIKAIAVKAGMDNSSVATATYTIVSLDHAGTQADPYTVADAHTAIDANAGVTGVYVSGIVCQASASLYSSKYLSYYISDDGTTTNKLEAYNGLGIGGANFTSVDDIKVGDKVVIYGNLTKYGSTYEFAEGNQLVSLEREKQDPKIVVNSTETVAYGSTFTVDDTMIEGGDITVTSSNTAVATVEGLVITPVAVGTTTITVATAESNLYNAGSGTFELTVTAPVGGTTAPTGSAGGTIFEETFAGCTGTNNDFGTSTTTDGNGTFTADSDNVWTTENAHGANGSAKFGASKNSGSATTPSITATVGTTYTLTFKAAPWGSESATMDVSVDGGTISGISEDAMSTGEWNNFTASITATATSFTVTFAASKNRFFLDDVKVEAPATLAPAITATLNGSGYATFCSEYPLDFSDYETAGYSAWQITGVSGETITFSQITGSVKGGTGLFLKGEAGATVTIPSADSSNELTGNKLEGTLAPKYVAADKYYGLSGNEFVKVNAGTVPAGKAILVITEPSSVKPFTFVFEGANGIETIENISRKEVEAIFNLAGQRTSRPTRGINIINGKKVLVR